MPTMRTTYRFANLGAIAEYLETRAREKRESATQATHIRVSRKNQLLVEAAAFENVADILRKTELTGEST